VSALVYIDAWLAAEAEVLALRRLLALLIVEYARARDLRTYAAKAVEERAA
jgi:hypothetical protein